VQIKIAEAAVMIDGAIVMAREDCRQAHALAERGEVPELADKLCWRRNGAWCVRQCRQAVDIMMEVSGASGLYNTGEMQRYFRDMRAIGAHIVYSSDVQATMFGSHALGIPGPLPML
jgi:3-hydroxy-9,10-secoandrosta-1,3,5(10)-triene-9,17-dione monooxygenase